MTLQELGKKHNTDKSGHYHSGKSYLDIYDGYFQGVKNKNINFLEIGVRDGCSLRMWKEYFSNGKIYSLDIDPRCKTHEDERIKIVIGDQGSQNVIDELLKISDSNFDIIVDDGSHINELTIKSFNLLYEKLNPGGFYVIEDLGNSYHRNLAEHIRVGGWPGMQYNSGVDFVNNREDMNLFFSNLIEQLDLTSDRPTEYKSDIEYIHFYSRIAVIKKQG